MNCNYVTNNSSDTQATRIKHVYGNVLRLAIPLTQRVRTLVNGEEQETEAPFYPSPNHPVYVDFSKGGGLHKTFVATMQDNVATIQDDGTTPIGLYQVEVKCYDTNDKPCRYMVRAIVEIVDATIDAGIQAGIEFDAQTYTLDGTVYYYAKGDRGYSVEKVEQIVEATENGGVNVIRVTIEDGQTFDFNVRNGKLTPTQEEELKHVVNWEGTFDVGSDFEFSISGHTFSELREIMDAGNLIHATFMYQNTIPMDFISKRSLYGYVFETIDATFHYYEDTIGVYMLMASEGANDSIVFTCHIYDSANYYTKERVDEKISNAVTPLEEGKLGYEIVSSLPSPWSANVNKLYLIADASGAYRGYFTNGHDWLPLGYFKPTDGIPKSDLEASVQATLTHADDTYTKAEVDAAIRSAQQLIFVYVGELPRASAATVGKIYLVPRDTPEPNNIRDEYVTIQQAGVYRWEKIGSTEIDLSNYATLEYVEDKTKMLKLISITPLEWEAGHDVLAKAMLNKIGSANQSNKDTSTVTPIFYQRTGYVYHLAYTRSTTQGGVITGATCIFYSTNSTALRKLTITINRSGDILSITDETDTSFDDRMRAAVVEGTGIYTLQKHQDDSISFYDYNDTEVNFVKALSDIRWHKAVVYTNDKLDPMGEGSEEASKELFFVYQNCVSNTTIWGTQTYHTFTNVGDNYFSIYRLSLLENFDNNNNTRTLVLDDFEEINGVRLDENGKIDPYNLDDGTRASLAKADKIKYTTFSAVELMSTSSHVRDALIAFRNRTFAFDEIWYMHYDSLNTSTSVALTITNVGSSFIFSFFVDGKFVRVVGSPSDTYTADIYNLINNTHNSITLQ